MAKTLNEKANEIVDKMTLEQLQELYTTIRQAIVDKADAELKQAEAQTNRLKAVKEEVSK